MSTLNPTNLSLSARWTRGPGLVLAAVLTLLAGGCSDQSPLGLDQETALMQGNAKHAPEQVTDLSVVGTTSSEATITWTQVEDGRGSPAEYQVRFALTPIEPGWGSATVVVDGACADPVTGTAVGTPVTCTIGGLNPETIYDFRLVSFRAQGSNRVYGDLSNIATVQTQGVSATTDPDQVDQVMDLAVVEASEGSLTVRFTQVHDGTGGPADYQLRYAQTPIEPGWGSATVVVDGVCADPVEGTVIGDRVTCTVDGFDADMSYDVRLVSFREDDGARIYGDLSNIATGQTQSVSATTDPDQVADLAVVEASEGSLTVRFTQVHDGTGGPADYQLRYAPTPIDPGWGSATVVVDGACADPVTGTAIGDPVSCTVNGLDAELSYDIRLVSFREEDGARIYGNLSNIASGVTGGSTVGSDDGRSDGGSSTSALHPNQPSGFTQVTERDFALLNEDGWRSIDDLLKLSIETDLTAPAGGSTVGRVRYPAGSEGGRTPAWSENGTIENEGMTSLYVSFWVKVSENWQGHPSRVNKIGFIWTHDKPVVFPAFRGADAEALSGVVYLQDTPDGGRRLDPNLGEMELVRGEWHQWEIVLISNTGGDANGEVHFWIDGVKLGDYRDVRFGAQSQSKIWQSVTWRPIWGGIGGEVQEDMFMSMARYYASGSR